MRKICLVSVALFLYVALIGQSKPKKAPTPQEMEAMKAKAQKELDKLTPEQRQMMKQMGFEAPTLDHLDNAAATAQQNPGARRGGFPLLNKEKIQAIPQTPTAATFQAFIDKLNAAVEDKLPNSITQQAEEIITEMKKESSDPRELGKGAVGLWLSGRPELAVAVAGEICQMDPSYAENINNYAAMLNMMDAQQAAVPLLDYLNKKYPGNPTILANLGQSWFGMGDFKKAEVYLDSAIRRFPKHSQANYTKSQIKEEKGDKKGAAENMKNSQETGYTDEKEEVLRRLGFPPEDIPFPYHIPQDPLGFEMFKWPAFPKDVTESDILKDAWIEYTENMNQIADRYREETAKLQSKSIEYETKAMKEDMKAFQAGAIMSGGPLSARAAKKLSYLMDDKDGGLTSQLEEVTEELKSLHERLAPHDTIKAREIRKLAESDLKCYAGEGSKDDDKEKCCAIQNDYNSKWLAATNKIIEETYSKAITVYKRLWSAEAYLLQYNMSEPSFEAKKAEYKQLFAATMATVKPNMAGVSLLCDKEKEKENPFKKKQLQEFDDVACKYYSVLDMKVLVIETRCSKMTTKINAGKFKGQFTEDLNKNHGILPGAITHGSVDISITAGNKGLGAWGPVKAEVGAGVDVHVEFNGQGIQEVKATANVKVSAGTQVFDNAGSITDAVKNGGAAVMEKTGRSVILPGVGNKSVSVGGSIGSITLNSGSGTTGTGVFSGLQLK